MLGGKVTACRRARRRARYVRLLDATGEFTAEVVSSATGEFRFFAAPGTWTVRALHALGQRPDRGHRRRPGPVHRSRSSVGLSVSERPADTSAERGPSASSATRGGVHRVGLAVAGWTVAFYTVLLAACSAGILGAGIVLTRRLFRTSS